MDSKVIKENGVPKLDKPVLIEGLPGVGNVGKLAAEYLISKLEAKKMSSIYSKHFPPQVLIGETGVISKVILGQTVRSGEISKGFRKQQSEGDGFDTFGDGS